MSYTAPTNVIHGTNAVWDVDPFMTCHQVIRVVTSSSTCIVLLVNVALVPNSLEKLGNNGLVLPISRADERVILDPELPPEAFKLHAHTPLSALAVPRVYEEVFAT